MSHAHLHGTCRQQGQPRPCSRQAPPLFGAAPQGCGQRCHSANQGDSHFHEDLGWHKHLRTGQGGRKDAHTVSTWGAADGQQHQ